MDRPNHAAGAPEGDKPRHRRPLSLTSLPEFPDISRVDDWMIAEAPVGAGHSQKGSEFSLEYLPNPTEVIEALNDIRVRFEFEDDEDLDLEPKRRATVPPHPSVLDAPMPPIHGYHPYFRGSLPPNFGSLPMIPNERATIQAELLDRLEAMDAIDTSLVSASIPTGMHADEPRLGIYNQEERIRRINAYREKRRSRVFGKVRYVLRKRASEGRSRVKGRFAKETGSTTTPSPNTVNEDKSPTASAAGIDPELRGGDPCADHDLASPAHVNQSMSWMEKMSLTARRMSGTFTSVARKRMSLTRQSSPGIDKDDEDAPDHSTSSGSWSSWLLKNRRKSSTSGSGRFSERSPSHQQVSPSSQFSQSQNEMVAAAMDDPDVFLREEVEPRRKRMTSGSSTHFGDTRAGEGL